MKRLAVVTTALIATAVTAEAQAPMTVSRAAMVSSCRFVGGQTAHLIVPFGSSHSFISIRNRAGTNDLSIIDYDGSGSMTVETNGGTGKIQFVVQLTNELLRGPFEIATKSSLSTKLTTKPRRSCGLRYRLSPN